MVFVIQTRPQIAVWDPDAFTAPTHVDELALQRQHIFKYATRFRRFLCQKLSNKTKFT